MIKILNFTLIATFAIFSIASVFFHTLPFLVPAFYIMMSIITFIIYAFDKSAAINGRWRTKESTLHLWAILGGWPGALMAQQKLRHKSSKQDFRFVFWVTVIMNLGGFIWLHTSDGSSFLYRYVHNADAQLLGLVPEISLPDFVQIWLWKLDYYWNK